MPLTWTPELNTGIRIIDLQHQELVDMINELEAWIESDAAHDAASARPLLLRLHQYVLFHFAHEEGLMLRLHIAPAHSDAHLAQHAQFAQHVDAAISSITNASSLDSAQATPLPELLSFLKDWLVQHIMGTDKALAALMRNK